MAGAIVGAVALPLAMCIAIASGVSPEKGLITAIIAGFLVSVLGGSRVQIGGPYRCIRGNRCRNNCRLRFGWIDNFDHHGGFMMIGFGFYGWEW